MKALQLHSPGQTMPSNRICPSTEVHLQENATVYIPNPSSTSGHLSRRTVKIAKKEDNQKTSGKQRRRLGTNERKPRKTERNAAQNKEISIAAATVQTLF